MKKKQKKMNKKYFTTAYSFKNNATKHLFLKGKITQFIYQRDLFFI